MPVLNDAKAVYLGTTPVDKVYAGVVQVWPSGLGEVVADWGEYTFRANLTVYNPVADGELGTTQFLTSGIYFSLKNRAGQTIDWEAVRSLANGVTDPSTACYVLRLTRTDTGGVSHWHLGRMDSAQQQYRFFGGHSAGSDDKSLVTRAGLDGKVVRVEVLEVVPTLLGRLSLTSRASSGSSPDNPQVYPARLSLHSFSSSTTNVNYVSFATTDADAYQLPDTENIRSQNVTVVGIATYRASNMARRDYTFGNGGSTVSGTSGNYSFLWTKTNGQDTKSLWENQTVFVDVYGYQNEAS